MAKKFVLLLMLSLLLTGCGGHETTPTGHPSGEIDQPQLRYEDQIYYYYATGFDEPLPETFEPAGEVRKVDNTEMPAENFTGCQLEEGQQIYASSEVPGLIYVKYQDGYAKFSCP